MMYCAAPQDGELGVVVLAPFDLLEAIRRLECSDALLDDDQRLVDQPAAGARGGERLLAEAPAIGRIEEDQGERRDRMRRAEIGGVAAEDAGRGRKAERLDVLADE